MVAARRLDKWQEAYPTAAALVFASIVSIVLYLIGAAFNHGFHYYYLIWNLFLAWLPLLFVHLLLKMLRRQAWSSWSALIMSFLWLIFLPNSFYMVSDFIHLYDVMNANIMFNVAMLASFAFSGMLLGYLSVRMVHRQLLERGHGRNLSWGVVTFVLLVSAYAIYLGRVIRLNSWDFFTNFGAVLYSISDQVIHPGEYPSIIGITISFFIFLMLVYLSITRLSPLGIIRANETRIRR